MASEIGKPYLVSDFLYQRIYKVVSLLEKSDQKIELRYYLAAVDVAKAIFLTTGRLLSKKRVISLLTSSDTSDFNKRFGKFPKKLLGL